MVLGAAVAMTAAAALIQSPTARADQPAATAAPDGVAPGPAAPAPTPAPDPAPAVEDPDPAWRGYDGAFVELGKGEPEAAREGLLELTTRWPTHPAAAQAALRLAELDARLAARAVARGASANRVARGEIVFWSTLGSVLVARDLCVDNCATDRESAAVYSLTVGAALGTSLLLTRDGVEPAEAQLYNSAQTWGSWNALAINDGFAEDETEAAVAIGSQFAGLAAGLGLWQTWHPGPGDVALANSGLLWGSLLTLWGHLAADEEPALSTVVLLGDVGIVAGALIANQVPMSRGRTLLIDLGGVLGTLAGGLVVISTDDEQTAGTVLFISTAAGLVIAGLATREWDVTAPKNARLVPTRVGTPGAGVGWGAALAIDL